MFHRVLKVYNYLFDLIFFNMVIRLLLESYLQDALSALLNMSDVRVCLTIDFLASICNKGRQILISILSDYVRSGLFAPDFDTVSTLKEFS